MKKQLYLLLLIFCAILSQGVSVFSDDDIEESSSLHIRRKRVVDKTRNGGRPILLFRARYIVNILQNGMTHCAGTILDADIIITIPLCIFEIPGVRYTILSNSALRNNGTPHHIVRRTSNPAFVFAMVKIFPPIELHHGLNVKIDLFFGEIPLYASACFSGWGCTSLDHSIRNRFPEQLMQTRLAIITHEECNQLYEGHGPNEILNICTFDFSRRRAACKGDEGGPLVYQNRLLGILLYTGWMPWKHPDVFFNFNNHNTHNLVNIQINALRTAQ